MFVPQRPGVVSYKQCAEDEDFAGTFDIYKKSHCAPGNVKKLQLFMMNTGG